MNENSGKSVSVTGGGSGVGITALIDGEVNIATASREMNAKKSKPLKKNGINPVENAIAYDGITVVVNPANPVSNLPLTSCAVSTMGASATGRMLAVKINRLQ